MAPFVQIFNYKCLTLAFRWSINNNTVKSQSSNSFSSVTAGDGYLFNCNAALVMMQKADPADFREVTPSKGGPSNTVADVSMPIILQGTPETTAIYADGRLFTRTFDGVICYDLRAAQ